MFYIFPHKINISIKNIILPLFVVLFFSIPHGSRAREARPVTKTDIGIKLIYPKLVNTFYELSGNKLFWFSGDEYAHSLRQLLQ